MSRARKVVSEIQNELRDTLQAHWRLLLFQGVAMLILSILALAGPAVATIAVDIYVGWLLLISGFVGVFAAFATRDVPAFLWTLLTAILSIVVGAMLIWKPAEGAMSLTIVFTAFFLAEGVFRIIVSFTYRDAVPGSWGWVLASGIFDLVLAAIIIISWPVSATWTLGIIVGINLFASGFAVVVTALEARSDAQSVSRFTPHNIHRE